jgi:hypothetical protein
VLSQIGVVAADAYAASRSNQTISLSVGASKTIVRSENPSCCPPAPNAQPTSDEG